MQNQLKRGLFKQPPGCRNCMFKVKKLYGKKVKLDFALNLYYLNIDGNVEQNQAVHFKICIL